MAQQVGILKIRKSVGELTGYKLNTSSKHGAQNFVRAKVTNISNPRTFAQAKQRAKARPAQIFYDAFENILNHAFFPTDKAIKNRNRFLSLAMSLNGVPDVKKGEVKLPFMPYQISQGSLGVDNLSRTFYGESLQSPNDGGMTDGTVSFALVCDNFNPETTLADFSNAVLQRNSQLQEGEELTIFVVSCLFDDPSVRFAAHYSVVLDKSDIVTKMGALLPETTLIFGSSYQSSRLIVSAIDEDTRVLAAGLIISSKTASSWKYTNSFMGLSAFAIDGMDWEESDIISSYMNVAASADSDKILQQADNSQSNGTVTLIGARDYSPTLKEGVVGTAPTIAVAIDSLGQTYLVVNGSGQLMTLDANGVWVVAQLTVGEGENVTRTPLKLSDITADGSPTVGIADVIAAGI